MRLRGSKISYCNLATENLLSSLTANRRGILALVCSCGAFSINDALTKIVVGSFPAGEVMFLRGLLSAGCFILMLVTVRSTRSFLPALKPLVLLRSLLDATAAGLGVAALVHLGVAELTTMTLTAPLLVTIMAALIYKEAIGWRRCLAIVVGLIGTLFIVKPDAQVFNSWALLGLAASVCGAAREITTRRIDPGISTLAIALLSSIGLSAVGVATGSNETWFIPPQNVFLLLAGAAVLHSIGTYLLVFAFRGVTMSVVAPFRYTQLIWSSFAGYIIFGEMFDRWSLFGAALIVGSGLYTLHRESIRRRFLATKMIIRP